MTAPNDDLPDGLEVLEIDGLTAREAATRLTDKSGGGAMGTDGPGEFWCPACGSRCTRNQTTGTEYGHLLDCPRRELPDPRDLEDGHAGRLTPSVGESAQKSERRAILQRALEAEGGQAGD